MAGRITWRRGWGVLTPGVLATALVLTGCGGGGDGVPPPRASEGADGGEWSAGPGSGGPTWNPSEDAGNGEGNGGSDAGHGGNGGSDTGNGGNGNGGNGGGRKKTELGWLPVGPQVPNTDTAINTPADAYDQLQDLRCADTRETVNRYGDGSKSWNLVSGLVYACLASKGDTALWAEAGRLYDSLGGPGFAQGDCRESAAYRTLNQAIGWVRQNPRGTVTFRPSRGGTTACRSGITEVDPGPEATLSPGDSFSVSGTWPDEITRATLRIGGSTVLELTREFSGCCHGAGAVFRLPESFAGAGQADLTLIYAGGTLTKPGVFRVEGTQQPSPVPPAPSPAPSASPSPTESSSPSESS
ncbi:hypothetical protein OG897_36330 [Streptomyces sp. NBC_00237]|uniref:hypothetical protein n=1 Tax=Streptomyces sp. NBC_00237 TaxID=2975687 RepID=UPI002250CE10|nr:hypothetical protein [Streptomyces sp. NBC_00237]MCX5206855.1 hypothetical protein [Streptomyces sp. NBC_00237]